MTVQKACRHLRRQAFFGAAKFRGRNGRNTLLTMSSEEA
jgi:hypothetical protein